MEICSEVYLEKDRTRAMNVLTTPAIDSAAFSERFFTHDGKKRPPNNKQNAERTYVSKSIGTPQPSSLIGNQNNPSATNHLTGSSESIEDLGVQVLIFE
ncbi:uncharacterized protein E6C27_scaffold112G00250 [Cucumis melo var. makuwa]|uniref:Uncharacterized protein n=1 Tax=Cucumis melo var. makuwa TaxID=1194695 RepID=A0A5A7SXH0_CUCMM|nr:uncharacterized protein E6C27_scaffold112G00250 [Cucumis melo var. makuwa]